MRPAFATDDPNQVEVRQPIHRRNKMAKSHSTLPLNGSASQELSLAAAIHDHISCTKVISSPPSLCHTDHIYANSGEISRKKKQKGGKSRKNSSAVLLLRAAAIKHRHNRPKVLSLENKRLREMVVVQLELIKNLQEDSVVKDRQIMSSRQENETLRARLKRKERHFILAQKRLFPKSDEESIDNLSECDSQPSPVAPPPPTVSEPHNPHAATAINLVTRYFGRRSKTVPSRALKRRYLGPPKSLPVKKSPTRVSSISSASEEAPESLSLKPIVPDNASSAREVSEDDDLHRRRKRVERPRNVARKDNFLTTDKAYFLPDNRTSLNSLTCSETLIDVPSWKWKPIPSFYQMEGTENINDCVFQRRHLKCEQDERRRKRWDMQRLREQKASERLKEKASRDANRERNKANSFYPDPKHIETIEVTDQLPVLAFGHLIPLFQPSEFSVPWVSNGTPVESPSSRRKD